MAGSTEPSPISRASLIQGLPGGMTMAAIDDAALMLTEIVTNAVRHSGTGPEDRFMVRMFEGEHQLRIEVEDPGAGFDVPAPLPAEGGYGLRIVDRLAAAWGMNPGARPPTVIWFEIPS